MNSDELTEGCGAQNVNRGHLLIRPSFTRSSEHLEAGYGSGCGHSGFCSGTCRQCST